MTKVKPTKAVIAAAGFGTRFLPQTKAMPKEMLPIVDKPVIQLIVEQLVASGVTDIIIVTGYTKRAIEDHFDSSEELEHELDGKGKGGLAEQIRGIANMANFVYVRQKGTPKGNARPLLNTRHLLNDDEPFFYIFADDFFRCDEIPYPQQLIDAYMETGRPVISAAKVTAEETKRFGMIDVSDKLDERTYRIKGLVEKPGPEKTPSLFASAGSFLLTPEILKIIEREETGVGGEIVLADSINEYAKSNEVYCKFIDGIWHDAGDKLEYLKTVVDFALRRDDIGKDFREYLRKVIC